MFWLDYTVHSGLNGFRVEGDWPGEVMGLDKDGNPGFKDQPLYQVGDIFSVNEDGWLIKLKSEPGDVFMMTSSGKLEKIAQHSEE